MLFAWEASVLTTRRRRHGPHWVLAQRDFPIRRHKQRLSRNFSAANASQKSGWENLIRTHRAWASRGKLTKRVLAPNSSLQITDNSCSFSWGKDGFRGARKTTCNLTVCCVRLTFNSMVPYLTISSLGLHFHRAYACFPSPAGIEPTSFAWEASVLTTRRRGQVVPTFQQELC